MKCILCGKNHSIKNLKPISDGRAICLDCIKDCPTFKEQFYICPKCGIVNYRGVDCVCSVSKASSSMLRNYGFKPYSIFRNDDKTLDGFALKGERYYGLELEYSNIYGVMFDGKKPALSKLIDIAQRGDIYYKRDSSLRHGVEMVTGILTKQRMLDLVDEIGGSGIFDTIKKCEYKPNAGIHIHVSRDSISPIDIYKKIACCSI